jgi:hypothetical protein
MRCQKARKFISLALDERLKPSASDSLAAHLRACDSCSAWRQEQSWLIDLLQTPQAIAPGPGFHAGLMARVAASAAANRFFSLPRAFSRPAVLRAAMVLLLVFSAALGFFLGAPLLDPAPDTRVAAFSRTLNLDAFADLPAGSFGAVYDRLLQGEAQ